MQPYQGMEVNKDVVALIVNAFSLVRMGLLLDIIGVGMLFYTSSFKRISQEYIYESLLPGVKEPQEQYLPPEEYKTHKRKVIATGESVRKNHRRNRLGLVLVSVGFFLQLVGTFF